MKKKIIILVLACFVLTGCEAEPDPPVKAVQMEYSEFELITDAHTGVVYIDNTFTTEGSIGTVHIYTPYYSKNGNLCRFVDGKVVEIE